MDIAVEGAILLMKTTNSNLNEYNDHQILERFKYIQNGGESSITLGARYKIKDMFDALDKIKLQKINKKIDNECVICF